uniref:RING-type domain-containing protein n=1 Tax=Phytophthora ramorum TaxID=164328 RepID=H3H3P4_PHYRM
MEPALPAAGASNGDNSTRCEACKSCGAVLELDGCGHRFHPRCIYAWPATHCEVCDEPVTNVLVFREPKNRSNSSARKGKWGIDEHKYAGMLMKQFQVGALPLADGLHLRVFMANMLHTAASSGPTWTSRSSRPPKRSMGSVEFTTPSTIEAGGSGDRQNAIAATTTARDATPTSVLLPSVSSLLERAPSVKVEDDGEVPLKGQGTSAAPSMKEILGFSSSIDQSPSPLSSDEWNDPSAFVDMALTDLSQDELSVTSSADTPLQETLRKGIWMNHWMKDADLEWSKGAISWSLSLSAEPLADFAERAPA